MGFLDGLEKLSDALGKADQAAQALKGSADAAEELAATGHNIVSTATRAAGMANRGRRMVQRLTNPERAKKPGTFEMLKETGEFLFGEGEDKKPESE